MNQAETDLAYQLLDTIMESVRECPDILDFPVRVDDSPRPPGMSLSSAGKPSRYLAHMQAGSPQKEKQPRYAFNMKMGTIAHDLIREVWAMHPEIDISDAEREVNVHLTSGEDSPDKRPMDPVPGHIDGFVQYKNHRILMDIKCVDQYSFNELDPRNPETNWWARSRKWAAGNFVFDAYETFKGELFKEAYLGQVAAYEEGLTEEGEEWDATAFILFCRNTGHFAVGIFAPPADKVEALINTFKENALAVLAADGPYDHDPCYEAEVGSEPHKVCQYCDYLHECFDVNTRVYRGKPRMQIRRIR